MEYVQNVWIEVRSEQQCLEGRWIFHDLLVMLKRKMNILFKIIELFSRRKKTTLISGRCLSGYPTEYWFVEYRVIVRNYGVKILGRATCWPKVNRWAESHFSKLLLRAFEIRWESGRREKSIGFPIGLKNTWTNDRNKKQNNLPIRKLVGGVQWSICTNEYCSQFHQCRNVLNAPTRSW